MKVALIATDKELADKAMELSNQWGDNIHVATGRVLDALSIAQQLVTKDVEVLICDSGLYTMAKPVLSVPLVELSISSWDLLSALREAANYGIRIGLLGLNKNIQMLHDLEKTLGISIAILEANDERVEDNLTDLCAIVASISTGDLAKETGLPVITVFPGDESIRKSFDQAYEIVSLRNKFKISLEQIKSMIDFLPEGIIGVDQRGNINFVNKYIEEVFALESHHVMGKNYKEYFPFIEVNDAVKYGQKVINEVCDYKGANYLVKTAPITLGDSIVGAVSSIELTAGNQVPIVPLSKPDSGMTAQCTFEGIITESETLKQIIDQAKNFSIVDSNVLIIGETGTGKELLAQSIHNYSKRKKGPFVSINCAALSESLLESELFGYDEGAFTGASRKGKLGLFELAHCGTLFLDEIGDISMSIQAKLLRVLQEKEIMRLGSNKIIPVDVRLITATNKDISRLFREGNFRQDLYHRINVLKVTMPPLRERKKDIAPLTDFFIEKLSTKLNRQKPVITDEVYRLFEDYLWPGNVRELENIVERLVVLKSGFRVKAKDLTGLLDYDLHDKDSAAVSINIDQKMEQIEEQVIREVLKRSRNRQEAAEKLGISATTLWRRTKKRKMEHSSSK